MKRSRLKEEQIVGILREQEARARHQKTHVAAEQNKRAVEP